MNKLTKYACILTALAGAVACSDGKKHKGTTLLSRFRKRWRHKVAPRSC